MNNLNSPNTVVLFTTSSPYVSAFHASLRESFSFGDTSDQVPAHVSAATTVKISSGTVDCYSDYLVHQLTWKDPLDEQDLVLVKSEQANASVGDIRDLLNFACPANSQRLVSVVAQPNAQLDRGVQVSIACSNADELDRLSDELERFKGNRLFGPAAVLLGVAKDCDLTAYCIVVEHPPHDFFPTSFVTDAMLNVFSQITAIELVRGTMSDHSIRLRKHLKSMAEKRNEEYLAKQAGADYVWRDLAETLNPIGSGDQTKELELIESLFRRAGENSNTVSRQTALLLKSELDRLNLYARFEDRFLDLFRAE